MRAICLAAAAIALAAAWPAVHAQQVIDDFEFGSTRVSSTTHGFGSTVAPGINAMLPGGDPARYFSWTTAGGSRVTLDNQSLPGVLQVEHEGGNEDSSINLLYLYGMPLDLREWSTLQVAGSGSGRGRFVLEQRDSDGDYLVHSFAMSGGSFGTLDFGLSSPACVPGGDGRCDPTRIISLEFRAEGFDGTPYRHAIDWIALANPAAAVQPIPEPGTAVLMLAGLAVALRVARLRTRAR